MKQKKKQLAKEKRCGSFSNLLFRGQGNACWFLETTLERFCKDRALKEEWTWKKYHDLLKKALPSIPFLRFRQFWLLKYKFWGLNYKYKNVPGPPPGYELMVYMRHHNFPSPLLDWTRSPYVAAYFAFNPIPKIKKVAIYTFMEFAGEGKRSESDTPQIWTAGPHIKTHKRHHIQQCEYTHCFKENVKQKDDPIYCSHEDLDFRRDQDILKKYTLPSSERDKVMQNLDQMNINAFSLFGNEEGLMDMLAYREIEKVFK